jgi:hypothetical protein
MYCPLYLYSDYREKISNMNIIKEENTDKVCVICWMPSEQHNHIKQMKEFAHIYFYCNCNVLIHYNCLNNWINNSPTCPICRKKVTILTRDHLTNYIKSSTIAFSLFCLNYTYGFLRIATFIYVFNVFCIITYNIYILFYFKRNYDSDDYNDYNYNDNDYNTY